MVLEIIDSNIFIKGTKLNNYTYIKELGKGANGVVYLVKNNLLDREEALKIWIKQNSNDNRDKVKQGLFEASKQAANNGKYSVQIYHIDVINNVVYATMEYVNGITLKEYYKLTNSASELISMAYIYLTIIERITTKRTMHGDPHWGNVIIFEEKISKYEEPKKSMKFCDFGTSHFTTKESSKNRHWKIVRKTILSITKKLDSFEYAKKHLEEFDNMTQKMIQDLDNLDIPNIDDFDESRMRKVVLRDYLDCFTIEVENEQKSRKSLQ